MMTARWYSGQYVGDAKPMARVTVHKPNVRLHKTAENLFANLAFGGGGTPKELPNVKSVSWNRNVDQDVASCTIEFYNTAPLPLGETPSADLDQPGYYTYNRGNTPYSGRWGHQANEWANLLMPDNILRTFEGYGFDGNVTPENDPNLVQMGVWMIDEVDLSAGGIISVTCRDAGRMLLDHISFPPVTPFESGFRTKDMPLGAYAYPVMFRGENTEPYSFDTVVPMGPQRLGFTYRTSSNFPYFGHGTVHGHSPRDGFDSNDNTWWLSVGNARPDQGYSFEWLEGNIKKQRVRRVRFKSRYAGHTAYLSLHVEGKGYIGSRRVPYDPNHPVSAPNGADVQYVQARQVTGTGWTEFDLGDGYANVTRVRVAFGGLQNSGLGPFPFRAGIRRFEVYGGAVSRTETTTVTFEDKNYDDYCADEQTEILTKRGWLRWDEVRVGDESLAINPATGVAGWQAIESVYRKHWDERPMISMESQVHSSLTTPDHRWLIADQAGRRHWRTTETLRTGHRIPVAAPVELPIAAKYEDDFVELVAWFWTEGWVSGEHGNACIAQSEVANPVHTARIRAALMRLFGEPGRMLRGRGAMWNESRRKDGVVTFRLSKPVKDALLEVAPGKVVAPSFLTSLTASQLELFIERSIDADGWRTTKGRVGLSQRDERRARSFEMALALAGRPSRTRRSADGMWQVTLLRHVVTMPQSAQVEEVSYSGHVWCPTLKHSNWLARRNGSVYFTGNTDIVKLFCAWGGFYWPRNAVEKLTDGSTRPWNFQRDDSAMTIKRGRVWGDFQLSGTYGPAPLTEDIFDKKPLMDGIAYVRDILGYIFHVDEHGGVVFRPPNIYNVGNTFRTLGPLSGERTKQMVAIDERQLLMDISTRLTSANIRERTFISNADGTVGGMAKGWNPNYIGMRRMGGWTDQGFESDAEARRMAETIALRQLFTYRTDTVTIPGYPGIQIDDQVRIFERVTSEGYIHYVKGIQSDLDLESGNYTYGLDTHWLGESPFRQWAFDPRQLSRETQEYLANLYRE